jgi:hypothetical protein
MKSDDRFRSDFSEPRPEMEEDCIDQFFAAEEKILPSSGFTASVMDAVRAEAAGPPPIPFPWKRAWPGIAAAGVALLAAVLVIVVAVSSFRIHSGEIFQRPYDVATLLRSSPVTDAGWTALGVLLSALSIWFSLRVMTGARN